MNQSELNILVNVVTYNNQATIKPCLKSVFAQKLGSGYKLAVQVLDNDSADGTVGAIRECSAEIKLTLEGDNLGFTGGHNKLLTKALAGNFDYVLILNPDVRLEPSALARLIQALKFDAKSGVSCPKLIRADSALNPVEPKVLDAAGMFVTPQLRHFDRGSNVALAEGRFERPEYVFGASGACVLLSRDFILDVSFMDNPGEIFDSAFFAYREDADLAWRAQWLGWNCQYVPKAIGYHQRLVLPERRALLPPELNRYSVRNRFLLQLNNFNLGANFKCILPTLWRNMLVFAGALTVERTSAGAIFEVIRLSPRALRRRGQLMKNRRVSSRDMSKWFSFNQQGRPVLSPESGPSDISSIKVVIVNYNSGRRLGALMRSLSNAVSALSDDIAITVNVVDNASSDKSATSLSSVFQTNPSIEFSLLEDNKGFAGAINYASKQSDADSLLILNPDVVVDAKSIRLLVDALRSYSNLGAVSPVLVDAEDRPQHGFSVRAFPSIGSVISELFFLHRLWPSNPWTTGYLMSDDKFMKSYLEGLSPEEGLPGYELSKPVIVDQPAGACLLVRKKAFDAVGGFDEAFWPAWHEDVDFSKRLKESSWRMGVLSGARVKHEGGYSLEAISAAEYATIFYTNLYRYWQKHGTARQRFLIGGFLRAGLGLRASTNFIRAVLFDRRTEEYPKRISLAKTLLSLAVNPSRYLRSKSAFKKFSETISFPNGKKSNVLPIRSFGNETSPVPFQGRIESTSVCQEEPGDWREYFSSKLSGDGVELGPLHRPMVTHPGMNMSYVDRMSVADLRAHYPELKDLPLVEPNIIDDAEQLKTVPDHSFDFLISAHLIEHTRNPLGAIECWKRVVRPGGYIYLIVPDKRFTFDRQRVRTTLEHMILDYQRPCRERDNEHFLDYAVNVDKKVANEGLRHSRKLIDKDYSIHFHVFTPEDMFSLLQWFRDNIAKIDIEEGPCKAPGSDEFHFLIRV